MNELQQQIESLLFVESKPLTVKKIAKATGKKAEDVQKAINTLQVEYAERAGGVTVVTEGDNVQLMTAPDQAEFVSTFVAQEQTGELTRPSLETLTIIAYRGPVPKTEIELIRGVNCSLILRNLLIRGLVDLDGETEAGTPIYRVTMDFLKFVGVNNVKELPEYAELNKNEYMEELLNKAGDDFFEAGGEMTLEGMQPAEDSGFESTAE